MGLVATQAHVLGRDQKFFVAVETVMGTFVKPVTGASCNVLTTSFVPNTKRKDRLDAYMASRDVLERITDKNEYSWSADMYWVPSGTKNTAPDCGPMVKAAMGAEAVNANDVTYSLLSSQAMTTCSMTRHFNEIWQEALCGAWVDEMKLSLAGGEEPKVSFSGGAMSYALTVPGTTNGVIAPSATTMILTAAGTYACMTNASAAGGAGAGARSVVQVNDGSSPDTDIEVTVDTSAPSFTTTAMTNGSDDAAAMTPYVPTHTDAGSPISGVSGTPAFGGLTPVFTGFELTLKNNIKPYDDEALTANVRDFTANMREITGSISFRLRQDHLIYIANRRGLSTIAITMYVGGAAQSGTRLEISIPTAEVEWSEATVPQTEEGTCTVPFKALGSSGNDAFTLKHT